MAYFATAGGFIHSYDGTFSLIIVVSVDIMTEWSAIFRLKKTENYFARILASKRSNARFHWMRSCFRRTFPFEQTSAVAPERLGILVGHFSRTELDQIDDALRLALQLD